MKAIFKRTFSLLILCCALFALALTASAETLSGKCGEEATYTLDTASGVLTISGTGPMEDYKHESAPWYTNQASVKKVIVKSGVTRIGDFAFEFCNSLISITIPDSVTSIGNSAFELCDSLTFVYYSGDIAQWEAIDIGYGNDCLAQASKYLPNNIPACGHQYGAWSTISGIMQKIRVCTVCGNIEIATDSRGDADGDGKLTVADALLTLRSLLNDNASDPDMDTNDDGKISLADIFEILCVIGKTSD